MTEEEKNKALRRYKKNKVKLNKIIKRITTGWKKNPPKDNKTNGGLN